MTVESLYRELIKDDRVYNIFEEFMLLDKVNHTIEIL